jgi:hypothetical protein
LRCSTVLAKRRGFGRFGRVLEDFHVRLSIALSG